MQGGKLDFTHDCIAKGLGWHNEEETGRFGPLVLLNLRQNGAIWVYGEQVTITIMNPVSLNTQTITPRGIPEEKSTLPQISYWVTSFGKIHRPGCSFYERGRGTLG